MREGPSSSAGATGVRTAPPSWEQTPELKRRRLLDGLLEDVQGKQSADTDEDADVPLPSDVEAAILFLRQEFFKQLAAQQATRNSRGSGQGASSQVDSLPPLVLVSQLHSMIHDKRNVEPEVESLRQRDIIRLFKLPTGADEHGLLLTDDYVRLVRQAAQQAAQQGQRASFGQQEDCEPAPDARARPHHSSSSNAPVQAAVAEAFCLNVIPNHKEVSISQARLLSLLKLPQQGQQHSQQQGQSVTAWLQPSSTVAAPQPWHTGSCQQSPVQARHQAQQGIWNSQHGQQQAQATANQQILLPLTGLPGRHTNQSASSTPLLSLPSRQSTPITQREAITADQQGNSNSTQGSTQLLGQQDGNRSTSVRRVIRLARLTAPEDPTATTGTLQQTSGSNSNMPGSQAPGAIGTVAAAPTAAPSTAHRQQTNGLQQQPEQQGLDHQLGQQRPYAQQVPLGQQGNRSQHAYYTQQGETGQQGTQGQQGQHAQHDVTPALADVPGGDLVTVLLQLGVIARHPVDDHAYLFCCPGMGPVIKSILAGRKELLAFISRKPHKEVAERALLGDPAPAGGSTTGSAGAARKRSAVPETEGGFLRPLVIEFPVQPADTGKQSKTQSTSGYLVHGSANTALQRSPAVPKPGLKLKQSILGVQYHLKDLLGRGDLLRVHSPAGVLFKLRDKHGH